MSETPPIAGHESQSAPVASVASSAARRATSGWGLAWVGALLGAATGTLIWLVHARLAAGGGAVASLGVGFGAGLGLRLVGRRSGMNEGFVAAGVAALGIAAGELLTRFVVPRILAEERGLPLARVMELLGSTEIHAMDFVFYAAGLYFAYRVASLPPLPARPRR